MPPVASTINDLPESEFPRESKKVKEMSVVGITAEEEYRKNPKLSKSDIQVLAAWAEEQPNFPPNIKEEQLILFYHSCFYNMEDTKKCMNVYYSLRIGSPEYFTNRDVKIPSLQQALNTLEYAVFPMRDLNGNQIVFHRLRNFDASKYVFADGVKLLSMAIDSSLFVDGTAPGCIFLFDMRGVKLTHLTRLSLSLLKKFFLYVQEGLPVRLQAIHVLNTRPIVDKIMLLIRPFLKKELLNMIHFHGPDDMEKVYEVLPKDCLPSDFGGELPSCEELHEHFKAWMEKLKDHFEEDAKKYVTVDVKKKNILIDDSDISLNKLEID